MLTLPRRSLNSDAAMHWQSSMASLASWFRCLYAGAFMRRLTAPLAIHLAIHREKVHIWVTGSTGNDTHMRTALRCNRTDRPCWQRTGFDGAKSASTYVAPAKIDYWEYDSPADPKFSALVPSGFGADRPLFNPDEPPYEVEKESVSALDRLLEQALDFDFNATSRLRLFINVLLAQTGPAAQIHCRSGPSQTVLGAS